MTDFPDWTAPQAHANAISTTGAPPLVFKQVMDVLIGQAIAANGSLTRPASGTFPLNQPGYEIELNVATLGGTATIVSVELQWYDSTFGALMEDETYYFYSGNVNGHLIHGRGPTKGDRVVVIITNHSGANQVTVSYTLLQTSRTFTREFWHTITKAGAAPVIPGFTLIGTNITGNVLGSDVFSIPASGVRTLLLPFYTGTVRLFGIAPGVTAGNITWTVEPVADPISASNNMFSGVNGQSGFAPSGIGSLYVPDVGLPRSQCQLQVGNALTAAQAVTTVMITQEDRA